MTDHITSSYPGAVLFTNEQGEVIFADRLLLNIIKFGSAWTINWEPLHRFLGLDPDTASHLVESIAESGRVDQQPLNLLDRTGTVVPVRYSGVAVFDDEGNFIGTDIKLWTESAPATTVTQAGQREEVRKTDTTRTPEEAAALEALPHLLTYFEAQIGALEGLLMRLGGQRFRDTLERILNEAAARNDWPVSVANGQVEIDPASADPDIYHGLLAKAVAYATRLFGRSMVAREMRAAEEQIDSQAVEQAAASGLGELLNGLG